MSYANFQKLIAEKGITPYRIAKDTGVSQGSLSDWKNGKSTPRVSALQKIARYLGVKIDDLIGDEADGETEKKN